jgi:hypothetical protein
MKTILKTQKSALYMLLFAMSISLFSCSKSDSSTATPANSVVGNWKITGYFIKTGTAAEVDYTSVLFTSSACIKDLVISFSSSGKVTGSSSSKACDTSGLGVDSNSTYTVTGTQITLIDAAGAKDTYNLSFSGNTMSWSQTDSGITSRIVFTKA